MPSPLRRLMSVGFFALVGAGCATAPQNPSFNVTAPDAKGGPREMRQSPRPLERPVVIVHGLGPPVGSWAIERASSAA